LRHSTPPIGNIVSEIGGALCFLHKAPTQLLIAADGKPQQNSGRYGQGPVSLAVVLSALAGHTSTLKLSLKCRFYHGDFGLASPLGLTRKFVEQAGREADVFLFLVGHRYAITYATPPAYSGQGGFVVGGVERWGGRALKCALFVEAVYRLRVLSVIEVERLKDLAFDSVDDSLQSLLHFTCLLKLLLVGVIFLLQY